MLKSLDNEEILYFQVCKDTNSLDSVKSLSCDGCRVNTGWDKGALRIFEELAEKEIQHLVCDLHLNEKVFQKVFIHVGKLILLIFSISRKKLIFLSKILTN